MPLIVPVQDSLAAQAATRGVTSDTVTMEEHSVQIADIRRVGVAGGGTMGFGIAVNFALAGYPTMVYDLTDDVLERSLANVRAALELFVEEGLIARQRADDAAARITTTTDLERLAAHSDFITEAIVERLADKQELFGALDRLCAPGSIVVSNTSRLMLSDIAVHVERQERIGLTHYFVPPHIVPGVEVAKGPGTSDETYEIMCELMRRTGRIPIPIRSELPGYLINRLTAALSREALRLWAEGVATAEDIELGVKSTIGFRMPFHGPFGHYDFSGAWRWPDDPAANRKPLPEPSAAVRARIEARMAERRPWFHDPDHIGEAALVRDREFVRRRKALYGVPRYGPPATTDGS